MKLPVSPATAPPSDALRLLAHAPVSASAGGGQALQTPLLSAFDLLSGPEEAADDGGTGHAAGDTSPGGDAFDADAWGEQAALLWRDSPRDSMLSVEAEQESGRILPLQRTTIGASRRKGRRRATLSLPRSSATSSLLTTPP